MREDTTYIGAIVEGGRRVKLSLMSIRWKGGGVVWKAAVALPHSALYPVKAVHNGGQDFLIS